MSLSLRKRQDGRLEISGDFPKEHAFSSDKFSELLFDGVLVPDSKNKDKIKMVFSNAEATYKIIAKPGEDESQPTAWVLQKVGK